MTVEPGANFGTYAIAESIGAGGMGEVWRAHDTGLKRDVALKVLPTAFFEDSDRLARFQREAEILASLNHPNIAQVYGLEKADGQTAIVMELVEGPTLADRIAAGPLPPDDAMGIAMQVVAALEAAHAKQIVHRDLKPANVKLRDDGTVKVLDFGISKSVGPNAISGGSAVAATPAVTETGVILGTAAYMSPEQARGKLVDERTDIWAFGCLLFEMLTAQPAFGGEDVMLTLARVLANDTNLDSIPGTISPAVRHTIKLCLEKDPKHRIADIRDVRLALQGTFESELPRAVDERVEQTARQKFAAPGAALAAGIALTALASWLLWPVPEPPAPAALPRVLTFPYEIAVASDSTLAAESAMGGFFSLVRPLVMSPDGSEFVYATRSGLMRREDHELDGRVIPGTENRLGLDPDFSPDGDSLLYYSNLDSELQRIRVGGGAPRGLMQAPLGQIGGWRWAADGMIYVLTDGVVARISPDDGETENLIEDVSSIGIDLGTGWLELLPGGEYLLLDRRLGGNNPPEIVAYSIATQEMEVLFPGQQPRFIEPGYLVYWEPTLGLVARAFDPKSLAGGDEIVQIVRDVAVLGGQNAVFSIGDDGSLVYAQDGPQFSYSLLDFVTAESRLFLLDDNGNPTALRFDPGYYLSASVSPNGERIAVEIASQGFQSQIVILDLAGDAEPRPITDAGSNDDPAWSPNGEWIAFTSNRDGTTRIYRMRPDGTGQEPLTDPDERAFAPAWVDDQHLAYVRVNPTTGNDAVYILDIASGTSEFVVERAGTIDDPSFSRQGDMLVYTFTPDTEIGTILDRPAPQIVIAAIPTVENDRSIEGAARPLWANDRDQLVYQHVSSEGLTQEVSGIDIVSVDAASLDLSGRRGLSDTQGMTPLDRIAGTNSWLVSIPERPDSQTTSPPTPTQIIVRLNWVEELKQRLSPIP